MAGKRDRDKLLKYASTVHHLKVKQEKVQKPPDKKEIKGQNKFIRKEIKADFDLNPKKTELITKWMIKAEPRDLVMFVCVDCKRQWFITKRSFECPSCHQMTVGFPPETVNFQCVYCNKSWNGYFYDDTCPNCRKKGGGD